MINPFLCYSFSFVVAILVYLLGWSYLFPPLSASLLIFLAGTVLAHVLAGLWVLRKKIVTFQPVETGYHASPLKVTLLLYAFWTCEFIYEGGIPLLKILLNRPYNYLLFGIPTLHVLIVTFSSFYTIYLFHAYVSSRKKAVLIFYLINLAAALLIYSRAMFIFNLSASFFILVCRTEKIPRQLFYILPIVVVCLLYLFGVLGTLRQSRAAHTGYDNTLILKSGKASEAFTHSPIPNEFFWAYVYMASPLANLQQNIIAYRVGPASLKEFAEMVNNEILPDFISKRINRFFGLQRKKEYFFPPFNVSTVYSRSYSYLGWGGLFIMACVTLVFPWLYMNMVPRESPFFLTGMAILSTMFLFLAYDNTIRLTGLSFQLVYPVLLSYPFYRNKWFSKRSDLREKETELR